MSKSILLDKFTLEPCPSEGSLMCTIKDDSHLHVFSHMVAPPAEPVVEKAIPPHKCNGVDGARRHGTANACTVCGRYSSQWHEGEPAEPPAVSERADGWIPVDERQPDSDRLIWVMEQFGDGGEFTNFKSTWGFYRQGKWLSYSHGELDESDHVRFWQEAPVPPARETIQSQ